VALEPRTVAEALPKVVPGLVDDVAFHRIGEAAMELLRAGNRHVDVTQPWKAAKDPGKGVVADALYTLAETVRIASALLTPILPTRRAPGPAASAPTSLDLRRALQWGVARRAGSRARAVLFPRIEPPKA
jgi:methionyl-tRNA synthetase